MNYFSKFKAFLDLTRAGHGLFLMLAVMIGQLVTLGTLPVNRILIPSLITPFFISAGAMAINDYVDYEADKKNKRKDRPLVTGKLTRRTALLTSLVFMPLGIISAYYINNYSLAIALVFALLSYAYALYLEKTPLIGNLSIAASMAVPFIFGALNVSSSVPAAVWILSTMAFLAGMGREIAKSIQDMEGDKVQGRRTLPMKIGVKPSKYLAVTMVLTAVSLSPLPYLILSEYIGNSIYILAVALADTVFIISIYHLLKTGRYGPFRKLTLGAIGLGLLAFLLPVLL